MSHVVDLRVFQATALLGLVAIGAIFILHSSGVEESTAQATEARDATASQTAAPLASVQTYPTERTNGDVRVSLLGITKGVVFLSSQEPAIDGGRGRGDNALEWLRVAVLIERLGDAADARGPFGYEWRTPDGEILVERIQHVHFRDGKPVIGVDGKPLVVSGHGSGLAQIDLIARRELAVALFPTAPPEVEQPEQASVFLITESGRIRDAPAATLTFYFDDEDARREFVFENVPMP